MAYSSHSRFLFVVITAAAKTDMMRGVIVVDGGGGVSVGNRGGGARLCPPSCIQSSLTSKEGNGEVFKGNMV